MADEKQIGKLAQHHKRPPEDLQPAQTHMGRKREVRIRR